MRAVCYYEPMNPQLIVEQKITAFVNKYAVYRANSDGSKGEMMAFAQQKRLAFKENVTFYSDTSKSQIAFTFRAEKVLDIHGSYFVEDEQGTLLGSFKKDFGKSLLKSSWRIRDTQSQDRLVVAESNTALALLRRFGGLIPFVGNIIELLTLLLRYHFDFTDPHSNQIVGRYQKTTLFRDHYLLSMTDTAYAAQDPRVLAGLAVGLDALQSR
jgi:hypothetical protein